MKKARLILSTAMVALMGVSALTLSSCKKDEQDCPLGYEGKDCDEEIRTVVLGEYSARDVDDVSADVFTYTPVIETHSEVSKVSIRKFGDFYEGQELVISNISKSTGNVSFSIPAQKPDGQYEVSGSGTFNAGSNTLNITYSIKNAAGDINNYTGVWRKK